MTEPNSTLKLRVKTSDRIGGPQVEETVSYRWDRIVIALVVILALASVAIWAWLQWRDSTGDSRHTVATGPIHSQPLIIEEHETPADAEASEDDRQDPSSTEPLSPAPVTERPNTDIGVAEPVDISPEAPSESVRNSSTNEVVAAEPVPPMISATRRKNRRQQKRFQATMNSTANQPPLMRWRQVMSRASQGYPLIPATFKPQA